MPTNTLKVSLEFLQNQLNNTSFGFKILDNGTPITFTGPSGSVSEINKTFKLNNNLSIKYMMSLNANFTPNVIDNNKILPGFDQPVEVIKRQSTGKYIVVGQFTKYRGELLSAKRICRLNADFTIDYTFDAPDFQYNIYTMDIDSSDRIYIGSYNTIGTRKYLQRLLASGELDTSYMNGLGFNQEVTAIKLQSDGKLLVGGVFTTFNSVVDGTITANRFIRLTTSGNKDTSFNGVNQSFNNGSGIAFPRSIAVKPDGKIVIGGDFILYNNVSCENIVVTTSTGAWSQTPTGLDNSPTGNNNVNKVIVDSTNNIYAVGNFRDVGGTSGIYGQRIIKLTTSGLPDTTFNAGLGFGFDLFARDIAFNSDGNIVVVGDFLQYNTAFNYVPQMVVLNKTNAALNPTGEISGGWSGPQFGINCVFYNGAGYIIGGRFTSYNNPNIYESQFVIPIESTSALTQTSCLDNLQLYNVNANVSYTQLDNLITLNYVYDDTHVVDVINIFDIPEYLIIRVDGSNVPPEISLINEPQKLTPAYNPVVFRFSSLSSSNLNFRYIVDIYNSDTNIIIGRLRIAPSPDYTGYVDISKILSNELTVDFDPVSSFTLDATNSYLNYSLKVGGEFNESWSYDLVEAYNATSSFVGYTQLTRSNEITNTFSVGDTISIRNSSDIRLNGLFNVAVVVNDYSLVIDLILPEDILSTTTGIVVYADNRKTYYADQLILDGYCVFNGVRSWNDFINWRMNKYTIIDLGSSSRDDLRLFLTDLPLGDFVVTPTQDLWLNFYNQYDDTIKLNWITNLGQTGESEVISGINRVMQVYVGPNALELTDGTENYIFYLKDENNSPLTAVYNFNIDNRCKIEDYEILFMDRMGSLTSYSFQLRTKIRGKIEKDTYKKSIAYNLNGGNYLDAYNINGQGTSISNINYSKMYELNTNWMSEENSLYFEQLLTSPFTWLKIDGIYYSCIIEEKEFEVETQRNKVLIRKIVNVTLGNTNTINI
jgi:uncharacterized delta-60 repeat protein